MANGFDRLEKFFSSKRKASAVSTSEPSTASSSVAGSPTTPLTDLSFPSPSFIRPKASRMAAREEFRFKQSDGKSDSEAPSPERKGSVMSSSSGNTAASRRLKAFRPRSSSFGFETSEHIDSVFGGFEFPKPPPSRQGNVEFSATPVTSVPNIIGFQASRPESYLRSEIALSRSDTPPSSDPEDSPLTNRRKAKKLQIVPYKAPPTPETSPEIGPVSDWQLKEDEPVDILDEDLCKDIQLQLEQTFGHSNLDTLDAIAPEELPPSEPSSPGLSLQGESLQEPDFDEFFGLSDDNVAESEQEIFGFPPPVRELVTLEPTTSSLPLREPPLLTLEPPGASRPATAAAFEAARIASRYNFDMLYVVNLWPEGDKAVLDASRGSSPSNMTGRLLGAYGLHNGPSPFQISSDVHIKVLQSDGWLEYRDEQALSGDFGRAYACSFFPGQYEDKRSSGLSTRSSENAIDRGIVFAAYRKPTTDGSMVYSTPEELAYLRRDVEAMVEMLIDVHIASRLRQPPLLTRYAEETGPMPAIQQVACA